MSEAERGGASRQDESGRLLAGRYRLGGVLGRGGMGTVWRAKDETLGRTVAVKELRFPSSIDEDEKRRLITRTLREAKAIARIRNNGAVTVFDVVDEDDRPWIVMELIEGKSLAEVIREDGVLTPKRAAEVGLAILDVLRAAHREGILHRDVKPSNVLIAGDDGRVVLTDFGIAQVEGDPSITSTGMLVGAPSYISPERARGHKPGPAADLWSLGGLLYASVEGVPPYDKGSAIATLTAVMTEAVEEPKNAGPLKNVIFGLLAKDPGQRLDDAGARAMLNEVIHGPEPKEPEPDATRVVALPVVPEAAAKERAGRGKGKGSSGGSGSASGAGGRRGEEVAERWRGALRSVRKAPAGAAVAGSESAAVAQDTSGGGSASRDNVSAGTAAGEASGPVSGKAAGAAAVGAGAATSGVRDVATKAVNASSSGRTSGWPEMSPPDLPPRPAPRAPLTDVVPRRTLVILAVAVVLALLGTVLALAFSLSGDDSGSDDSKSADTKVAVSGGVTASSGEARESSGASTDSEKTEEAGRSDPESGSGAEESPAPSNSPSASGGEGAGSGGGGSGDIAESTYNSSQGFTIGLPAGWTYQSTGAAGSRFSGPDGQKLLVGWTTTPKDDPVADWKNQEQYMTRSQYQRIRIEAVDYRGWNTADWEFTYVESGTKYRSTDRGFVVDPQLGYGLMYTAKASKWDSQLRQDTWRTFTETFRPKS
ncbi:serine/threonine-protein kinase [Streptomyces sp. NPDC002845]